MNIQDMTSFDKFLTPTLIKVVYWIGNAGIALMSLMMILSAFSYMGRGVMQVLGAIVFFVVGLIFWRVMCEGIMLTFRIYDRLTEIRDRLPRN
ncbi:hypothetical protein FHS77_000634 [Paenochrobactrum gallinarii]|uniref:DUF4282 domain-containing protein n=1 Tax=Paenochrobactrum gallinarii TaxID=643673 RepID=A0A841LT82_9HYPH|nr:DUF4282 domain-containing protein [Paenochrobactrum gallinarii]MBB6260110.1 hypothetical protein [Paenochrobactrum gallinarii]